VKNVDKRHRLDEEPFSYRITKDNKVFIAWQGKQVMILTGKKAQRFMEAINALDHKQAQLALAKLTGNFKRGNERRVSDNDE
jgi:hypothetical protein